MTNPETDAFDFERDEAFDEGGTWLLDLVAAVDHLRRGHRPGITVWEALEEATTDPAEDDFEPGPGPIDWQTIQAPLRRWLLAMADRYNDGHHWPHPAARRPFPPVLLDPSVTFDA